MCLRRDIQLLVLCLTAQLASAATKDASQEEPQLQADVYNELYEAHLKCEKDFSQTRSEFIVEMFERNRGNRVSKELLTKLLLHNIRIARKELKKMRKERERYVSVRMNELENSSKREPYSNDRFRKRQEQLKSLDDKIGTRQRYVEVSLCVLSVL